jgi:hypothetical protein
MEIEQKVNVICAFDHQAGEMWYVDTREKLSRRLLAVSLDIPPLTLDKLKAMIYDEERKGQDAVVDIDGWFYSSRRARGLDKGLFAQHLFVPDGPAN